MKKIIFVLGAGAALVSSCKKANLAAPDQSADTTMYSRFAREADGKEDEDRPILMHKVLGLAALPLQGALVVLTRDTISVYGYTDSAGTCRFSLPVYGIWQLQISHERYDTLTTQVDIMEKETMRNDTLLVH